MTKKQKQQEDARSRMLKHIKPSDTLGVIIKSVSRSGLTRRMRVIDKEFHDLSSLVADAIGWPFNEKGILVSGCGMDMAFHLMDVLTWALYGKEKPKNLKGNGGSCIGWRVF